VRLFFLALWSPKQKYYSRQHFFSSFPILDFFLFRLMIKINSSLISSLIILPSLDLLSIFLPSLYPSSQSFRLSKPQIFKFQKGMGNSISNHLSSYPSFFSPIRVINSKKTVRAKIFLKFFSFPSTCWHTIITQTTSHSLPRLPPPSAISRIPPFGLPF